MAEITIVVVAVAPVSIAIVFEIEVIAVAVALVFVLREVGVEVELEVAGVGVPVVVVGPVGVGKGVLVHFVLVNTPHIDFAGGIVGGRGRVGRLGFASAKWMANEQVPVRENFEHWRDRIALPILNKNCFVEQPHLNFYCSLIH
jgi:hypothetical protein